VIAFLWWRFLALLLARYELIPAPSGAPYLSRWHFPAWLARACDSTYLFLHYFHTSDPDRGWHCHPWTWCESWILRGAYAQAIPYFWRGEWVEAFRVFQAGDRNRLTDEHHAVSILRGPVWTLFRAGPKHGKSWGFMDRHGRRWAANGNGVMQ
jgi:hypothetical protein